MLRQFLEASLVSSTFFVPHLRGGVGISSDHHTTISEISQALGVPRGTIWGRLSKLEPKRIEGKTSYYDPVKAFTAALSLPGNESDEMAEVRKMELRERGLLHKSRREQADLETGIKMKTLHDAKECDEAYGLLFASLVRHIEQIPGQIAAIETTSRKERLRAGEKIAEDILELLRDSET